MIVLRRAFMARILNVQSFSTKTRKKVIENQHLFPDKLLHKKHKTPSNMYIISEETALQIDKAIDPFLRASNCDTAMEFNPGIGLLTRRLLERGEQFRKILLIEAMDHFMPHLSELQSSYPERLKVRSGEFVSLWKLVFQDKMDNGARVTELLHDVPQRPFEDDPNILIFGAVGNYNFFKQLINSLVFQNSLFNYGRSELFLIVPPPIYIHLTCDNEIGYLMYRATTILFQIMFEYRFISLVPRDNFLPFQSEYNISKSSKLGRVNKINPEHLYLVKIVPRRNLFELCDPMDLPALWYFVKQNYISRRNRVIPNLEKWAPGCGPRLIINFEKSEPVKQLYTDEDPKLLPKYSRPCTTMNNKNYCSDMNIFTQFGDLTASQMLTLFTQFRNWPEYNNSAFLASLENSLLKMEASADEIIDNITEEDDMNSEDSATEHQNLNMEEDDSVTQMHKRKR